MKWSKVAKPKKVGGLGIREQRQTNIALIAKVVGQLVVGVDNMWTHVLNKYIKDFNVLDCEARISDYNTWKGILRSMVHVYGGYGWSIGNGASVSLWFDA